MKLRIRTPEGANRDRDLGPGPVGTLSSGYQRAMGAVPLTQAIAPAFSGIADPRKLEHDRRRRAEQSRLRRAALKVQL